ncbi:hypothetical protein CRUP_008469 [Coryphaenoides rupestris]|nr:hypothetical protein CRUP_008469 [Coryphaenoides rupestris]
MYIVTAPPAHGHLEYVRHPGVPISTFSQMDVVANLVAYGLTVPQGASVILGPGALALSDPDTPPGRLVFVVHEPPRYGRLTLAGGGGGFAAALLASGSNFTQRQLEELAVAYRHDGGPAQIDRFTFTARYGIFLSSRELRARDGQSGDEEVRFCVVRPLYFGYLENTTTGDFVEHCFSQTDLNRRTIVYVINTAVESLSDSLEFKVSDPLGNVGAPHTLELRWSSMELSQSRYSVCEDQGTVSLEVTRKGNLAESSYVSVKVKEITATAGKDFQPSASSLIQFDPGVVKRSWTGVLLADDLEEAEETFTVTLETPEGAVLGGLTSAMVTLRDAKRGVGCRGEEEVEVEVEEEGIRGSSVLGGEEVETEGYRQHGSIHVEKLPLGSDSRVIWPRGDGLPSLRGPEADEPSRKKTLRARGSPKTVEDEASPSRKGRKASVRVASRGPQQQLAVPAVLNAAKLAPHRKTLMKAAKSEGGLSRGRMRNSDSGHKCWVQTLSHFSDVNKRMEEGVKKHGPLHKDLAKTRMKRDAEAIELALKWFEENNPFDHDRDKQLLVSFSTGFTSTADDTVNAERVAEVGREMQIKLDGQSVTSTMEVKFKVQALSSLRKIPKVNEKKIHLNSLKLFNKAGFSKTSLKELTDPLNLTNQPCSSLAVDGGWLLYMVKWEQGQTWQEIADSYLSYVQCLGSRSQKIIVVFDGYSSSAKDHDHIRCTKNSCCDLQFRPDMIHLTPRAKFMDNTHNKSELIHLLSSTFRKRQITVEQCDNDADTSIVRAALAAAADDSVEVRAEDADVLVMLVHHSSSTNHPLFLTTSKGSYDFQH